MKEGEPKLDCKAVSAQSSPGIHLSSTQQTMENEKPGPAALDASAAYKK
jgi:hypothetical protein